MVGDSAGMAGEPTPSPVLLRSAGAAVPGDRLGQDLRGRSEEDRRVFVSLHVVTCCLPPQARTAGCGLKAETDPAEVSLEAQRLQRIDRHFARYVDDGRLSGNGCRAKGVAADPKGAADPAPRPFCFA